MDERKGALSLSDVEDLVADYVVLQCGIRQMKPESIKSTYLPGIQHHFIINRQTNHFGEASRSREIKALLKGFDRFYRKRNPASGEVKAAFGMDLAVRCQRVMEKMHYLVKEAGGSRAVAGSMRRRIYVCMAVGIFFMLRCSEHMRLPAGRKSTATLMLRKHVVMFDQEGRIIPYVMIGVRRAHSVTLNVKFAKTDSSGFGRRTSHIRQTDAGVCVVCILEDWIFHTRDTYGATEADELYNLEGLPIFLPNNLHDAMAITIADLRLPQGSIKATSHSLRYGGATMMAAASFPQYLIAHYGGWTEGSRSLAIYTKPSEDMLQRVSSHMVALARDNPSERFIKDMSVNVYGR